MMIVESSEGRDKKPYEFALADLLEVLVLL